MSVSRYRLVNYHNSGIPVRDGADVSKLFPGYSFSILPFLMERQKSRRFFKILPRLLFLRNSRTFEGFFKTFSSLLFLTEQQTNRNHFMLSFFNPRFQRRLIALGGSWFLFRHFYRAKMFITSHNTKRRMHWCHYWGTASSLSGKDRWAYTTVK
jgi:hypothetical protein